MFNWIKMNEKTNNLLRSFSAFTAFCLLLVGGCEPKLNKNVITAVGQCSIDLDYRVRESCLANIPPLPNRWKRINKNAANSFGYVCAFYSIHGPLTCSGEVRTISRWIKSIPKKEKTYAILYFAPSRIPHRPSPDSSGIRMIESDGDVFLFFEIDDYVAVIETSDNYKTEARNALVEWAEQLTSALQLQTADIASTTNLTEVSAEEACLSYVNSRPSTLNDTSGALLNVSPGDIAEEPVYWGERWERDGEPFFFTVNGTEISLIRLVDPGNGYALVLLKEIPNTLGCIIGIWAHSFGGNGIEFIDISRMDDTNNGSACIRIQLQGWLRAYLEDAQNPDSVIPAKPEFMEVILETDGDSVRCVTGPGC